MYCERWLNKYLNLNLSAVTPVIMCQIFEFKLRRVWMICMFALYDEYVLQHEYNTSLIRMSIWSNQPAAKINLNKLISYLTIFLYCNFRYKILIWRIIKIIKNRSNISLWFKLNYVTMCVRTYTSHIYALAIWFLNEY